MDSYIYVMLEIMLIVGVTALIVWRFLEYLDGMGRLQKRLRIDQLMQTKCKVMANNYQEDKKYTCAKCTDIKEIRS